MVAVALFLGKRVMSHVVAPIAATAATGRIRKCAALVPLDYWLARPLAGELVGAPVMAGAGLALAAPPLRRRLADLLEVEEPYLAATARGLRTPAAWRAFAADQRMLVRNLPALEAKLATIRVPTTIVSGSADRVVPLSSARGLQETIPGATLVVLPDAGHLITQRQAPELARVIRTALSGDG